MQSETLERLKRSAAIPSMPQVMTRFLQVAEDPDFRHDDMVEVLGTDPGMVGDVLRMANSAFFGVTNQIDSLRQAVTLLGVKRVRSLVIGRYMVDHVGRSAPKSVELAYFWRRSLATGVLAARLAGVHRAKDRDAAFIAGLLADIGVIVMAGGLGADYDEIARLYAPRCDDDISAMEQARFGVTHAQVSAIVLGHWKLPANICAAVAAQDEPVTSRSASSLPTLAGVIRGAAIIARVLADRPSEAVTARHCAAAASLAGVELSALAAMLGETASDIEALAKILKLDVIDRGAYARVSKTIQDRLLVTS
jgi:HD-like signal output (HDOD) protein